MLREPPYHDDDGDSGWNDDDSGGDGAYSVTAVLRDELASLAGRIDAAFIYGPLARGAKNADCDIDVIIIGQAVYEEVIPVFIAAEKRLNRTIHPSVYRADDWRRKLTAGNRMMLALMREPKLFVLGTRQRIPHRS